MSIRSTRKRLVYLFFVAFWAVAASSSGNEGCWVESGRYVDQYCPQGQVCVEWEVAGETLAAYCCNDLPVACISCATNNQRIFLVQTDFLPPAPVKEDKSPRHAAPRIPLLVDHVPVFEDEIRRFDGMPLHFLACRSEAAHAAFQAFTTREGLTLELGKCRLGPAPFVVRDVPEQATGGIVFYEGRRWSGAPYHLPAGQSMVLSDTWWDERMASLRGFGAGGVVTLFENADFSGSTLTLTTDLAWPDLGVFGWEGRVSALLVWPASLSAHKPSVKTDSDD